MVNTPQQIHLQVKKNHNLVEIEERIEFINGFNFKRQKLFNKHQCSFAAELTQHMWKS